MKLSPNFTKEELIRSQLAARHKINNEPNDIQLANLIRLAEFLERVRSLFARPLLVSSGFRCHKLNCELLKSKPTSQHMIGCAADFTVMGVDVAQSFQTIKDSGLPFDQVIKEYDAWIHLSIPRSASDEPRELALIIDSDGTRRAD